MKIIRCRRCGYQDKQDAFPEGRGRAYGEHPEHYVCPQCRASITWYGADVVAVVAEGEEVLRTKQAA